MWTLNFKGSDLDLQKLDHNIMNGYHVYVVKCSHLRKHFDSLMTIRPYYACDFPSIYCIFRNNQYYFLIQNKIFAIMMNFQSSRI